MSNVRGYQSFSELRREMRGSSNWSNHIDEIADTVGRFDEKDAPKQALFDSYEDLEDDDE